MYYVINGLLLAWCGMALRAVLYGERKAGEKACWYNTLMAFPLVGALLAGCGFAQLARTPAAAGEYGAMLSVLAALAAGAIIAAFAFKYPKGRVALPTLVAGGLTALLYLVFGAISYYLGASGIGGHLAGGSLVAFVMLAFLVVHVLYDNVIFRDAE